jgi:hypothetical protein
MNQGIDRDDGIRRGARPKSAPYSQHTTARTFTGLTAQPDSRHACFRPRSSRCNMQYRLHYINMRLNSMKSRRGRHEGVDQPRSPAESARIDPTVGLRSAGARSSDRRVGRTAAGSGVVCPSYSGIADRRAPSVLRTVGSGADTDGEGVRLARLAARFRRAKEHRPAGAAEPRGRPTKAPGAGGRPRIAGAGLPGDSPHGRPRR